MDRIDVAVVSAMDARRRSYGRTTLGSKEAQDFEAMRAALLAGMKVLLGPVVDEWRDAANLLEFTAAEAESVGSNAAADANERKAATIRQCAGQLERIYAPSLGEGE